jgi:VCBS repeat-containing protein
MKLQSLNPNTMVFYNKNILVKMKNLILTFKKAKKLHENYNKKLDYSCKFKNGNNMKKTIIKLSTLTVLTFAFTGCGGGGGSSADTGGGGTPTTTTVILSGTAIDGLIKNATVCIDTNQNNLCDSGEPTTTTDTNGNYSFDVAQNSGTKNIIVLGGIDTATNSAFTGILKEKVSIETSPVTSINITPLTTTATLLADEQNITIASAKQTIATKLGLSSADISKNPLENVAVYKKTQEIVQATKVLQSQIQKDDTNQANNQKAFDHIIKQIALTLKDSATTETLNIGTLATKLEATTYNNQAVVIPSEVKTFTANYIAEVNTKLASVNTTTNLNDIQNGLEIHTNTAKTNIKNNQTSTLSSTLSIFEAQSTATIVENGSNGFFGDDGTPTPITPTNQKPVATFISFTTDEDTQYNGTLTATDVDGNTLTYSKVSNALFGTVIVNSNGNFTYIPSTNYSGADSFSYKVNDGTIDSLAKTVNILINGVEDAMENLQEPVEVPEVIPLPRIIFI